MKSITVRENGISALEVANRYFSTVNLGMSVSPMNQDDVDWCIALARESDFDIDWRLAKMSLTLIVNSGLSLRSMLTYQQQNPTGLVFVRSTQ